MNKYESVVIINPNLENEAVKALVKKFSDLINTDGKVSSVDELGKKKLAYEIKKHNEAHYVIIYFDANPDVITELERLYRIADDVIKYIVVRLDEKKLAKAAEKAAAKAVKVEAPAEEVPAEPAKVEEAKAEEPAEEVVAEEAPVEEKTEE